MSDRVTHHLVLTRKSPLELHEYVILSILVFSFIAIPLVLLNSYVGYIVIPLIGLLLIYGAGGTIAGSVKPAKTFLRVLGATLGVMGGVMLLRGFFTGDGYAYWLPLARTLVEQGGLPAMIPTPLGYTSREPLYPLLASIGLFFGNHVMLYAWIGPFFTAMTLMLLHRWIGIFNLRGQYLKWLPLLFFSTPLVLFWSWNLLQESLILFIFTVFFYHADAYRKTGRRSDMSIAFAAAGLAALTKYVGLFLIVPSLVMLWQIRDRRERYRGLAELVIAYIPALMWFVRNAVLYGSPIFPILASAFPTMYGNYARFDQFLGSRSFTVTDKIIYSIRNVSLQLPIFFAGVLGLLRFRRFAYFWTLMLFAAAATTILFSQSSVTRYYYPFVGLLVVFGVRYIAQLRSRTASFAVLVLSIWPLLTLGVTVSTSGFIHSLEKTFAFVLPVISVYSRHPLLLALVFGLLLLLVVRQGESRHWIILSSIALGALHLRFIENKSWLAVWPWVLIFIIGSIIFGLARVSSRVSGKMLYGYCIVVLLSVTWGMGIVYGIVNRDFSFASESRIYDTHALLAKIIDERENGGRDYYVLAEDAAYYVWQARFHVVSFRSYNFNVLTKASYLHADSPEALRQSLRDAGIRYIIDQGEEIRDPYVGLAGDYLSPDMTLLDVVHANPQIFSEVYSFTDTERNYTNRLYSI